MKKKEIKLTNIFKISILFFSISLLLWNCEKEIENNHDEIQKWKVNDIPRKTLESKTDFNIFLKNLNENKNLKSKSSTNDIYNFTIDYSTIREIALENKTSYTFKVNREKTSEYYFENLVVISIENKIEKAYLLKYTPSKQTEYTKNHKSITFEGNVGLTELNVQHLEFNYSSRTIQCTEVTVPYCSFDYPHIAGADCWLQQQEKQDGRIYFVLETICEDDGFLEPPINGGDDAIPTTPILDTRCPTGSGKIKVGESCICTPNTGKVEDENGICKCPKDKVEDIYGNCLAIPTPCETALLSRDVYNTNNGQQELGKEPIPVELSGGWELNNTLDTSSMNLTDPVSGFNSAVYQKLVNGDYQYIYVTEGTNPISVIDWMNNFNQISGNSLQYKISSSNAEILNTLVGKNQLYFTGHSLGGGLASINALVTGRIAFTYNAAGLSNETRLLYNRGHNSKINATVVKGEIVDRIQNKFGIKAEDSDQINYIEEESTYWQDFFNEMSPALKTYKALRLHMIETVIDILDCE